MPLPAEPAEQRTGRLPRVLRLPPEKERRQKAEGCGEKYLHILQKRDDRKLRDVERYS